MLLIENFKEFLYHEFPEYKDITSSCEGYRVDGNGIKKALKLDELKSVDYFLLDQEINFLEFSDILRQRESDLGLIDELKLSDLSPSNKKIIKISIDRKINKEVIDKFKDSIHIKGLVDKEMADVSLLGVDVSALILAIAPIKEDQDRIDVVKYLDQLKNNIISGLPKNFVTRVIIKPIDKLSIFD